MPRKRERTYAELLLDRERVSGQLKDIEAALAFKSWQRERTPGDTVQVQLGKSTYQASIGQRKEEGGEVLYFVYIDRADGFGADGHKVKSDQVCPIAPLAEAQKE